MLNKLFKSVASVLTSKIDDEIIIMSLESGYYLGLDPVASRIWEIISDKPSTVSEVVTILTEEYEVDAEQCQLETETFITTMVEEGTLQVVTD